MFNFIKNKISYLYRNILSPRLLTRRYKDILNKNLAIKDMHLGQRCFILGSGPSIKDIKLDELKEEHVFVVNEFDKHPQFKNLQHVYHIIPDTFYFKGDKSSYYWERLKAKSDLANPNTVFFFHIRGKNLVEKEGLFTKNKVYYINTQGIISDHFDFNINLDKTLPWPKNSILSCLMIAVYLGFREIYLLGCEHNFLAMHMGLEQGKNKTFDHFYASPELDNIAKMTNADAAKVLIKRYDWDEEYLNASYENTMRHVLQLFKNYRLFHKKVKKLYPDIRIFNATPNSFLDVFPFINYDEIPKQHEY